MLRRTVSVSAYNLFVKEQFALLKDEDLTPQEKMIMCGHRWKTRFTENRNEYVKNYIIDI